jgi:CRP-like cAMP-binding protein
MIGWIILMNLIKALQLCELFKGFSDSDIQAMLQSTPYSLISYGKNQIIAVEGEACFSIGIVITGSVDIKKIFASGKTVTIMNMNTGDIFGEVLVFSKSNKYPSTIMAAKDTKVLFISRDSILRLSHNNLSFLNNIMSLLANKVLMFNDKVKYLSMQTIRQKISNLLIDYYKKQNSLSLILPIKRKEMAELLDIPRPSLSREMIKMRENGIISFHNNHIEILDLNALESELL